VRTPMQERKAATVSRPPHLEDVAEDHVQHAAVAASGPHRALGNDDVPLRLDPPRHADARVADKRVILDLSVSNAVLPQVWNAPGINHSTSSVRHARIAA